MLKMNLFILLFLFISVKIFSHNEFYDTFFGQLIEIQYTGFNGDDILHWENTGQIPLYLGLLTNSIPDDMDPETVQNEFGVAENTIYLEMRLNHLLFQHKMPEHKK